MGLAVKNEQSLNNRFNAAAQKADQDMVKELQNYLTRELQTLENRILYHLDEVETGKKNVYDVRYINLALFSKHVTETHLKATPAYYKLHEFCADASRNIEVTVQPRADGGISIQLDLIKPYPKASMMVTRKPANGG